MTNGNVIEYTPLDQIPKIVEDLRASFATGITRNVEFRKQQLMKLFDMINDNKEILADCLKADLNMTKGEAYASNIEPAMYEIGYMLENMDQWLKPTYPSLAHQPSYMGGDICIQKVPQGVVFLISPWNYPVRLTLIPLIGAIASGNVALVKQSELSVNTTSVISRLLKEYMDERVVRIVNGGAEETTVLLDQRADHLFYTGSGAIGKIVAAAAAKNLCKTTLELGGKCPAAVFGVKSKDSLEVIARRIIWGKFYNCGQTCVGVDYVLVEKSICDNLVSELLNAVNEFYGSNPINSPDFGRIINKRQFSRLVGLLSKSKGTINTYNNDKLVSGTSTELNLNSDFGCDEGNLFVPPTIVTNVQPGDSLLSGELFGPILPVVAVDDVQSAIDFINSMDYPLALYSFNEDVDQAKLVGECTRSGSFVVNDTMIHTACHSIPFGGFGPSGLGSYFGLASIETFTHGKSTMIGRLNYPPKNLDSLRFPPYSGSENEWKGVASKAFIYPTWRSLRSSFISKMLTYIPGWRTFSILPIAVSRLTKK
ncbi:hypothetical protein BB559_005247 [Furculomyces boomerangus]|uniref:Aldehyde dehydrogenase n=1 Tax=Furculomyces boomerangus TaxID=61424 RepID=A0A2T9Y9R8_9FUNG|nr:hypothetical protein BB559_005247 [Furculomyces boomerangus]